MTTSGVPGGEWSEARRWWRCFEPIHAVTYFADECRAALAGTGLRGFWMGYFAARSVPLGTVSPAVVTALFFGFDEEMVAERRLPAGLCELVGLPAAPLHRFRSDLVRGVGVIARTVVLIVVEDAELIG